MLIRKILTFILAAILLSACASSSKVTEKHPEDPFEALNREIYTLNKGLDTIVFKPIASIYYVAVPSQIRKGVTNFFSNIGDITVFANKVLQFKIHDAVRTAARFGMNSTFGIGGIFDIATEAGLYKMRADFGLTLAHYGMKRSPYLMLPVFGPSTIRDTGGFVADWFLSPWAYVDHEILYIAGALDLVNIRANLLDDQYYFDYAAMDEYSFMRDIYLQRRNALIDGQDEAAPGSWGDDYDDWDDWELDEEGGVDLPPPVPEPLPVQDALDDPAV
jgi:phospholipid-binding lipoprotein MlaA